jgi:SAM-dependent methyltransferase
VSNAEEHNAYQRAYYAGPPRRAIAPADTPYVRRHLQAVLDRLGEARHGRVLEIGAGEGRYTLLMHALGMKVFATDLSGSLLERLKARVPEIPTLATDLVDLPRAGIGLFDAVVGFFVLHHLHDLAAAMAAVRALLKPEGCTAFCEPNGLNPLFYLQILMAPRMTWRGDGGVRRMRPGPVETAMRNAGLKPTASRAFGLLPGVIAGTGMGRSAEALLEPVLLQVPFCPAFRLFSASGAVVL